MIDLLRQRSRPYLFSNTLAPAIVGASLAVLDLVSSSSDARRRVMDNAVGFRASMTAAGFRIKPGFHPIVPVMMSGPNAEGGEDARLAKAVASALLEEGIYVVGFSFPVVPKGQARIRVQLSAGHTSEMIERAVEAFIHVGRMHGLV
jgi:glycine C-acetyltransferase